MSGYWAKAQKIYFHQFPSASADEIRFELCLAEIYKATAAVQK